MPTRVLFLCPHNAAKSVIAASLLAREATRRGVALQVDSAGTEPDEVTAPPVVSLLAAEDIDVSAHRPRRVTKQDVAHASHVVSMGCDVDPSWRAPERIERWDDVPMPSVDLGGARQRIGERVVALLERLA